MPEDLIRIGERRIQALLRVSLGKDECEDGNLKEGDKIEVWYRRVINSGLKPGAL